MKKILIGFLIAGLFYAGNVYAKQIPKAQPGCNFEAYDISNELSDESTDSFLMCIVNATKTPEKMANFVHTAITYDGNFYKDDFYWPTVNEMLQNMAMLPDHKIHGDCKSYVLLMKALIEKAGITNDFMFDVNGNPGHAALIWMKPHKMGKTIRYDIYYFDDVLYTVNGLRFGTITSAIEQFNEISAFNKGHGFKTPEEAFNTLIPLIIEKEIIPGEGSLINDNQYLLDENNATFYATYLDYDRQQHIFHHVPIKAFLNGYKFDIYNRDSALELNTSSNKTQTTIITRVQLINAYNSLIDRKIYSGKKVSVSGDDFTNEDLMRQICSFMDPLCISPYDPDKWYSQMEPDNKTGN